MRLFYFRLFPAFGIITTLEIWFGFYNAFTVANLYTEKIFTKEAEVDLLHARSLLYTLIRIGAEM